MRLRPFWPVAKQLPTGARLEETRLRTPSRRTRHRRYAAGSGSFEAPKRRGEAGHPRSSERGREGKGARSAGHLDRPEPVGFAFEDRDLQRAHRPRQGARRGPLGPRCPSPSRDKARVSPLRTGDPREAGGADAKVSLEAPVTGTSTSSHQTPRKEDRYRQPPPLP